MTTSYLLQTDGHLVEANFELEGIDETFPGYHNPNRTWNGWACPLFTREVAQRITRALNGLWDDEGDRGIIPDDPDQATAEDLLHLSLNEMWDRGGWTIYPEVTPFSNCVRTLYTSDGICWMRTEEPSEAEQWVTRMADGMRAEIAALMAEGFIPLNVHLADPDATGHCSVFARLHDYCDANMLAEDVLDAMWNARFDPDPVTGEERGDATDILNVAQQRVDRWLSHGGHLWGAEGTTVPDLDPMLPLYGGVDYSDGKTARALFQERPAEGAWVFRTTRSYASAESRSGHYAKRVFVYAHG